MIMVKTFSGIIAVLTIFFQLAIVSMILMNALPFFMEYSLWNFLLGTKWHPVSDPPEFGILVLLWGSFLTTYTAMLVAVPLGIATAIFISGIAPHRIREVIKPAVEILGNIPSVVWGLFGTAILAPFAQKLLNLPVGQCAAVAGITLGIMSIPIVVSVTEDALTSVPKSLYEAGFSLGSTKWEVLIHIIVPAAKSGIWTAVLMCFGRAIGETMTVLMVAGGAPRISLSIFSPVRTMTAAIASEMGETPVGSLHYNALFAVAGVLFVITLVTNLIANKYARSIQK